MAVSALLYGNECRNSLNAVHGAETKYLRPFK